MGKKNEIVVICEYTGEVISEKSKSSHVLIKTGAAALLAMYTQADMSALIAEAATVAEASKELVGWDSLINATLGLLDPVARIFGVIAGIAIMTGNGKIGLERLFWLSIGYITARKVEMWIAFLNHL